MESNIVIIACSIFKNEIESLRNNDKISVPVVYANSMLHMFPKKLQTLLDGKIKRFNNYKIILVFGDCHAGMVDYEKNENITRTPGINCCEIFLGTKKYKHLRKEGAFVLLPEWAARWKEVFVNQMGFTNPKSSRLFMNDMHKKLVYVDTGYETINHPLLNEISNYLGLPLEIHKSSICELEKSVIELLDQSQRSITRK